MCSPNVFMLLIKMSVICSVCKLETTGGQDTVVPCSCQEVGTSAENKGHSLHIRSVGQVSHSPQFRSVGERQHSKVSRDSSRNQLKNDAGEVPGVRIRHQQESRKE